MRDLTQTSFEGIEPEVIQAPAPNRGRGRPRGTKGRFRSTLDRALRKQWPIAFTELMEGVKARDPMCTRIYWERVMPAPKRMAIELSTADDKPLRIETPADARAAMAQVLSMVATGEVASDEADELITCYGKYLAANSIHTLSSPESDTETIAGDVRVVFAEKLGRIIETRQTAAPIGAEVTEEELEARVLEAVARKLEDR